MATHTLNDEEYQKLLQDRTFAEQHAAELEAEIVRVRQEDPAMRIAPLAKIAREMLTVVRFAVANLPPQTTRGWPTKALHGIADRLAALPDFSVDDRTLINELRAFARECDDHAILRERERQEKITADAAPQI